MTRLTIKALQKLRDDGVKIAVLTCYDASFARCSMPPAWTAC